MFEEAKTIVSAFFENVRSGKNLQAAYELMHEQVIAHQVQSEDEYTITRSPKDYIVARRRDAGTLWTI